MNHKKMMEFFLLSRIRILTETSLAVKAGMKFTEFVFQLFQFSLRPDWEIIKSIGNNHK